MMNTQPDTTANAAANTAPEQLLHTLLMGQQLGAEDTTSVFRALAAGAFSPTQIAALLATLRTRGETPTDITGAAQAFIEAARPFPVTGSPLIDCVGTGGDGANTINISTTAALLAAAGGLQVVKHGNRSVSSKSGAADVLEALGFDLGQDPDAASQQLASSGFCFLFAPGYHPAFAHVMPVRKELAIPTIFNVLGPLLNPARPALQLMGTVRPDLGPMLIESMRNLGRERALVVHGSGTDEVAVHGSTDVWELRDGEITQYSITPSDLGLGTYDLSDLVGGEGSDNAQVVRDIFAGTASEVHRDAVLASAGALFYLADAADSWADGVAAARDVISSGRAATWLAQFSTAGERA